ncbi:hypothetical protein ACLNGM_15890 [Aureimonas phyllosphaerae]|uniref:hypothetical protein n=1 Tax=Aureimonas phyllosphaerae TaxID=1166078 RepID=UPI003A5C554F
MIHVGGVYGDVLASRERWARTWETLPEPVRRRLVLEHDDLRFSAADTLWLHARTGVRLVFDHQHFWCLNPDGLDLRETVSRMLSTWPAGEVAKIHYSSPRTELREQRVVDRATGRKVLRPVAPVMTGHADFINPFEFVMFLERVAGLDFDVMLEAKAKDLALFRLREDLRRYGGALAARFGLSAAGRGADRAASGEAGADRAAADAGATDATDAGA